MPAIVKPKDKDDLKTCTRHMGVILSRFKALPPQERGFVLEKLKNVIAQPWTPREPKDLSEGECQSGCCGE